MSVGVPFELGKEYEFFGVDGHKFKLGPNIFEAQEDPDDGYRSYLGSVVLADKYGIFFDQPLDAVRVVEFSTPNRWGRAKEYDDFDGYAVESTKDGHRWLVFGTADISDYYPGFAFHYTPRAPEERRKDK